MSDFGDTARKGFSIDDCISKIKSTAEKEQDEARFKSFARIGEMVGKRLDEIPFTYEHTFEEYFMSRFDGSESLLKYVWMHITKPLQKIRFTYELAKQDFWQYGYS